MVKRAGKNRVAKAYLAYGLKISPERSRYSPLDILNDVNISPTTRIHIMSDLKMFDKESMFVLCLYVWGGLYKKHYYNEVDYHRAVHNLAASFNGEPIDNISIAQLDLMCGLASRLFVPMCNLPYHQWLLSLWHSSNEGSDYDLLRIVQEGVSRLC